ncbi:MAG: hypothetical protein GWN46_09935 [Gammaproteobacteria bacterium]|nr:hypothetical protein [Gammaproteobacteria bacterium]
MNEYLASPEHGAGLDGQYHFGLKQGRISRFVARRLGQDLSGSVTEAPDVPDRDTGAGKDFSLRREDIRRRFCAAETTRCGSEYSTRNGS